MHVFLYEWITGGGLVEQTGPLPASLLAEGSAMISALAADFAAIPACRASVLRDARLSELPLPGCEVVEVHSLADQGADFRRLTSNADYTLIIAPEFDSILSQAVRHTREAGGRSLNASEEFVALTTDKHRTAERLRLAGVPAPAGRVLAADELKLPTDFAYPAVLKPLDGAGSQHMLLVEAAGDEPPPYPFPRRLEHFIPGRAASVAVLCGEAGLHSLPPCWQHLSTDGRFAYRGGAIIHEAPLAQRATKLAIRALEALPPACGYIGVDLVLSDDEDGAGDAVIEINPRLTTSYVGLRATTSQNLAQAMLDVVEGREICLPLSKEPLEFTAAGDVWMPARQTTRSTGCATAGRSLLH